MGFCLPKFSADTMLKKIKSGDVNPEKLSTMTSKERRDFFKEIVGEDNAQHVNALFEGKLLLKNQQRGMVTWAKQLTGIKPEARRDILSRINKITDVLQPKQLDMFLEDLAAQRIGVSVTTDEAQHIADLAKKVNETDTARGEGGDRLEYGRSKVEFNNYVHGLKEAAGKRTIGEIAKDVPAHPLKTLSTVGGQAKSLKASLDNSAIFRQGWKTMFTHPTTWMKNAATSFKDIAQTVGGKEVMDEVNADIVSRPTYDKMVKAKLAVGTIEEAYPSTLPAKIPGFGRIYKASETAYTAFIYRQRADIFDKYLDIAQKSGLDITDKKQLEQIGSLVNSLTGRGNLGPAERGADTFNNIFFSPRFIKSHVDTLLLHPLGSEGGFVRKQAAKNLAKIIVGNAIILAIANALKPGSVEADPRSGDFGKIKIGDTRFDVSGGMASVLTLAARLATFSSKSASGAVTQLNSGKYGSQTAMDVGWSFLEGKFSPIASVFRDFARGQDMSGNPTTVGGEASNLFMPLPITNFAELKNDPNSAGVLAGTIADALGVSVNSYGGAAALAAHDKPEVTQEVFDKLANGDTEGAQQLAHDFNTKLKDTIQREIEQKNPTEDPVKVADMVDKKWKKDAIYMPSDTQVQDYKANGNEVVQKVLSNGKPVITKDAAIPTQGVIGAITTYARAIGTDPVTAFHDIFAGQKIKQVSNGTIMVERMSLSDSSGKKEKLGGGKNMTLDHIVPLEGGGTNEDTNLQLITADQDKANQKVEDSIGKQVKAGNLTGAQAREFAIRFKAGSGQQLTPELTKEYQDKYKAQPMSEWDILNYKK